MTAASSEARYDGIYSTTGTEIIARSRRPNPYIVAAAVAATTPNLQGPKICITSENGISPCTIVATRVPQNNDQLSNSCTTHV